MPGDGSIARTSGARATRSRSVGRLRLAVTTLLVCGLLGACTADPGTAPSTASPTPSPTSVTPSPSATAPRPSPSPPPQRPSAMQRTDVEGAIAAAQYFLELYPYAYNTGELTEWRAMSHPECIFCASVIENVEELHASGGYKQGGLLEFESVEASAPEVGGEHFAVDFVLEQNASQDFSSDGKLLGTLSPKRYTMRSALLTTDAGWLIREVTPERLP